MIVSISTKLEVAISPDAKTFSNISARIWNVLSNEINCDVSMSIYKCNLKLFLLHNELVTVLKSWRSENHTPPPPLLLA